MGALVVWGWDVAGEGRTATLSLELNDQLSAGLRSASNAARDANGRFVSIGAGVTSAAAGIGKLPPATTAASAGMKTLGAVVLGGALAIGTGFGSAIRVTSDFEQKLSNIGAVGGRDAALGMDRIRQKALDIGRDTAFGAGAAAGAMEELIKAGVSVEGILGGAADATVSLAAAGEIELPRAAEIASAAMNQFRLTGEAMPKVADLFAGAANVSAIGVEDIGAAMNYVGPVAASLQQSIGDTTTAVGLLGNVGIKGTSAGTQLRASMLALASPSGEAAGIIKQLGINVFDATGKMKPLPGVFEELKQKTAGLNDQARAEAFTKIFGREAVSAVMALVQAGEAGFSKFASDMGQVKAADVARDKLNNLAGSMTILRGSLQTAGIMLGGAFTPLLKLLVDGLTLVLNSTMPLIQAFANWMPSAEQIDAVLTRLKTTLSPLGALLADLGSSLSSLSSGNLGVISAAVAAFAVAMGTVLVPAISAVATSLPVIGPLVGGIGAAFGIVTGALPMAAAAAAIAGAAWLAFKTNFLGVQTVVQGVGNVLQATFSILLPLLTYVGNALRALFAGDLAAAGDQLSQGLAGFAARLPALGVLVSTVFTTIGTVVLAKVSALATSLGTFALQAIPLLVSSLQTFLTSLAGLITTYGPVLVQTLFGWATALGSWVWNAIPPLIAALAGFGAILFGLITAYVPVLISMVLTWASALVSFVFGAGGLLRTAWSWLMGTLGTLISSGLPLLINQVYQWAVVFAAWVPGAVGNLAAGLGSILASVLSFIISAVPPIIGALASWVVELVGFAIKAIPGVIVSLVTFIGRVVQWIVTSGLPMLIKAAIQLATGLVKGFLSAIAGGKGEIEGAAGGLGAALPNGAEAGARSPWATFQAGQRANANRVVSDTEMEFMRGGAKSGAALAAATAEGIKANQGQVTDAAAGMAGAGAGAAMPADAGAGAGKGAAGAGAQDPVQTAMQSVQQTGQMIQSGLDAIEKMFSFRGLPPPEILDAVFDALKEIMKRAMSLAAGVSAESAQAAGAVAQMLSGFTSALTGMVDLAEKLARFRVPAQPNLDALLQLGETIVVIAKKLVAKMGEAGLAQSLEQSAISQKTAEMLKAWVDTLTGMAEATQALAKGRWTTIDMGGPERFFIEIARFAVWMQVWFRYAFPQENMRLLLMDSRDTAETLKPWIENLKGIAEATQALAKARWQIDMGKPEAFFVRLAYFVIGLQQRLARDIGYTILLALDDAKLVAEVIKPWIENLSAAAEATGKLARARFPSDLSGPERFFTMLAGAVVGIARSLQQQLTNDLLVVLEDAKLIAETLSSWLEPLKATQEVAASIGRADLGVDMSGLGAFYVGLWNQLTQLHSLIAVQTAGAILIVLEDSKLIAETLGAWMDPLTSTADVLGAIDTLRLYASKRGDQTLSALWEFLSGLAVMTGRFVATGQQVLSGELLSALDTSREIAETFGKWLDPLGKLGEVALSVDKVRLRAHTRWDTTMNAAGAMFVEIAMMSGALASGAARALGGQAMRAMEASRQIADTFLKWLEPLSKLGEVATSVDVVRRMAQTRWDSTLGAVKAMFAGIGFVTNEVVQAVQREADPEGQLKVSQVVGQTFGTWLDILAKLGQATDSIRRTHTVDAGVLRSMVMMLATIASTSNEIVQAVQRAASPEEQLGVSRAVAETFDAWVKTFGGLKTATQALAEVVDIPDNVLSGALNLLLAMTRLTAPIVQAVMRAADPGPVLEMSRAVADTFGSWIKVFADTADLTHKLVTTEPVNPSELGIVEGILSAAWAALLRISADFRALGDLVREDLLSGAKAFIEMAGGALDLFSKARDLDLREVIPLRPEDLAAVETTIQLVFSSLVGLVDRLMPKLTGAMQRLGERGKAFLDLAKPALDLFAAAAPLGEKLYGAVAPSEASYLMLSGVIARVVLAIEQLAVGWAEGKARLTESVAQMTGFSSAARAALDVVKPALEAFQALSNSEQGRITPAAVNRVRATVATMMQLIDELKTGYLNARGELDAARTGAISGFSDAAKSTLDAAGGAVDFLVKLFDSQGKLGALTSTAKAQIKAGIQAVVGLMMEMALQYDMATLESRKAIERSVAFADETSKMAGSLGGVVDALAKIYDFAFKENAETGKREAVIRQWGGNVRAGLQGGIEMVILTLSDILSSVGSYALSRAQFVADRIAPVASAIGSMTEPIQKLMENPLVDSKSRTAWSSRAAQTRIKQLADNMVKGIQTMVDVMVRGLKGVKVPSGIDAGVSRLISVVNGLVAAIDSAMQMPEIDFGVLADLVKASRVLAEISLPAGAAAGALALGLGSPGAPGPGALALPPSIGAPVLSPPPGTGGIGGAVPLPQTIELDGATVVLTNAVLSGDVTATGRILVEDGQEVTVELDGEVISKSQKSGDFQRSRSRSAGDPG